MVEEVLFYWGYAAPPIHLGKYDSQIRIKRLGDINRVTPGRCWASASLTLHGDLMGSRVRLKSATSAHPPNRTPTPN